MADGRVLRLIQPDARSRKLRKWQLFPTERGTPQGGVISPVLSNILLTPFDWEMRPRVSADQVRGRLGYHLYVRGGGREAIADAHEFWHSWVCSYIRRRRGLCTSIAASSFWGI